MPPPLCSNLIDKTHAPVLLEGGRLVGDEPLLRLVLLSRGRARRMQARLHPALLPGEPGEGRVKESAKRPPATPSTGSARGGYGGILRALYAPPTGA